jgi:hypothetical protein
VADRGKRGTIGILGGAGQKGTGVSG